MVETELSTAEVAIILDVSSPTVIGLVRSGVISAREVPYGSLRFRWRIDAASVERYRMDRESTPRGHGRSRGSVAVLRKEVAQLAERVDRFALHEAAPTDRLTLASLQEVLVQQRRAAQLQAIADQGRSTMIEQLVTVLRDGEAANEKRQQAVATLNAAVDKFITSASRRASDRRIKG